MYVELFETSKSDGAVWGVSILCSVLYFIIYLIGTAPKNTKLVAFAGGVVPNRQVSPKHFVVFFIISIFFVLVGHGIRYAAT